jgi:hypothetical protein
MSERKQGRPEKGYETDKLNNRVKKELKDKFIAICIIKGYSAQLQLEMMLDKWIKIESEDKATK